MKLTTRNDLNADCVAMKVGDWRLSWLNPDGRKLLLARALRTFGYGYLAVVLAIYLQTIGLNDFQIGAVLTAALVGSAVMNAAFTVAALGVPFFASGAIKIVYDALTYFTFKNVRPPEEEELHRAKLERQAQSALR